MREVALSNLPAGQQQEIARAIAVRGHAYCPYSEFPVSALAVDDEGEGDEGVNVENAAYKGTCGERSAINAKITRVGPRTLRRMIVIGEDFGDLFADYVLPCGDCRQHMREFCNPRRMRIFAVLISSDSGEPREIVRIYTLAELLKDSFGPEHVLKSPIFAGR